MNKRILKATENEVNIGEKDELQELIKKLAILSVDRKIKATEITSIFSEERRLYIESLREISEESEDVKQFRKKAEKFFREQISLYLEKELGWKFQNEQRREFEIATAIEIACASYSLFKISENITQNVIYDKARDKMPDKPKGAGKGCWGSKFDRVRTYTSRYLSNIVHKMLADERIYGEWYNFARQYHFRTGTESTMLKLIFLIENCNS